MSDVRDRRIHTQSWLLPGLRQSWLMAATAVWVCIPLWFGALRFSQVTPSWSAPVAIVLVLSALVMVGAAEVRALGFGPWQGWALVAALLVAEALVVWAVHSDAYYSIAHWVPLVAPVVVVGLLRRGMLHQAVVVVLGISLLALGAALARSVWDGPRWGLVCLPVVSALIVGRWLLGFFELSDSARRERAEEGLRASLIRAEAEVVEETADRRRAELARSVSPLLSELTEGAELDADLRQRASVAAHELRDGLRARQVMTEEIRDLLYAVRRSGTTVAVVDDRSVAHDDQVSALARRLIQSSLPSAAGGAEVTYRISPDGKVTCVVTELAPDALEVIARALTEQGAAVVLTDDALWAQGG